MRAITIRFLAVTPVPEPGEALSFARCRFGCGCTLEVCGTPECFSAGVDRFGEQVLVCACCVEMVRS